MRMLGFKVWRLFQVASSDELLYSLFSTICVRLESNAWGSRYPVIMKNIYSGNTIEDQKLENAQQELNEIMERFSHMPASDAIWNIDKEDVRQGVVNEGNYYATSLKDFFINGEGSNLLAIFSRCLEKAIENRYTFLITTLLPTSPKAHVWPPEWGRPCESEAK